VTFRIYNRSSAFSRVLSVSFFLSLSLSLSHTRSSSLSRPLIHFRLIFFRKYSQPFSPFSFFNLSSPSLPFWQSRVLLLTDLIRNRALLCKPTDSILIIPVYYKFFSFCASTNDNLCTRNIKKIPSRIKYKNIVKGQCNGNCTMRFDGETEWNIVECEEKKMSWT